MSTKPKKVNRISQNQSLYLNKGDVTRLSKLIQGLKKACKKKQGFQDLGFETCSEVRELLERIGRGEIKLERNEFADKRYPTSIRISPLGKAGLTAIARSYSMSLSGLIRAIAAEDFSLSIDYTRNPSTPTTRESPSSECQGRDDGDGAKPHPTAIAETAVGED